jgi:hypothetical protein
MMDIRSPGGRTAVQKALNPLIWNGITAIYGTKKSPTDGRIGISIPTSHDGVYYPFL